MPPAFLDIFAAFALFQMVSNQPVQKVAFLILRLEPVRSDSILVCSLQES